MRDVRSGVFCCYVTGLCWFSLDDGSPLDYANHYFFWERDPETAVAGVIAWSLFLIKVVDLITELGFEIPATRPVLFSVDDKDPFVKDPEAWLNDCY